MPYRSGFSIPAARHLSSLFSPTAVVLQAGGGGEKPPTPSTLRATLAKFSSPIAAAFAILPTYYFFEVKSALQEGKPKPPFNLKRCGIGGLKLAPTISLVMSSMIYSRAKCEKSVSPYLGSSPFAEKFVSSTIVAGIASPLLAILNNQGRGVSWGVAARSVSLGQVSCIMARETCFLFSLAITGPLSAMAKEKFGENPLVSNTTFFVTGAFGSLAGHPPDTILNQMQAGIHKSPTRPSLLAGGGYKAFAIGTFMVIYKNIESALKVN